MRYDTEFEQDSLETFDELSDAFETGLRGDSFETGGGELGDTETFGTELSNFEQEFDQEFDHEEEAFGLGEGEDESEGEVGRRGRPRAGNGNVQQKLQQQRLALAKLREAVGGVGRHVRKEGGRLRFTLPARSVQDAAAKIRVDPRMVSALLKSLQQTNARGAARQRSEIDTEMDETGMWQEVSGACPGVTKFNTHWWGVSLWLNECHTKLLLEAADAGSGAAGICAVLAPEGISKTACAVAAGVLKIGGFVVKRIDALGGNKGITIRKPWVTPLGVPPVLVWHQ